MVHFEIPAENPERAVKFYQTVFDWKIEKWAGPFPYWLVTTGPDKESGINGAIMDKGTFKATVNTVDVASVDDSLEKIVAAGGKIVIPKGPVQGVSNVAYASDTEGNIFGVFQSDASAK